MLEFRVVGSHDATALSDVFSGIDQTFFRPHPMTDETARRIAGYAGRDVYALFFDEGRPVAYGMLRGWDEGYPVPSLGIAVRTDGQGRGIGRLMMAHLHAEAARRGASVLRLRVHPENVKARRLYESLGYVYTGKDRDELVMLMDLDAPGGGGQAPARLVAKLLDIDAPEWEEALRSAPHDFYHLPAYVQLCAVEDRGDPRAVYVSGEGKTMLLPLVLRDIQGSRLDATSPYGYPGPVGSGTDEPAFLRIALAAGVQVLREAGVVSAFIRLHPLMNVFPLAGVGTYVQHGETVSVDLTVPTSEIWTQTRLNHRRDITRATRLGFTARMDGEWQHLESFMRMYRATMTRHSASEFYFFEDAYFTTLRDALGESLHLCVVEKDGSIAAGGLFVETNGIVQYHLSGTDDDFRGVQPTKLMMHFVEGWAKERGNRILHLGGGVGGDGDSLLWFKGGFSPLRHTYASLRMVIDEAEYGRLVAARDPDLDPDELGGFFPLYRQA